MRDLTTVIPFMRYRVHGMVFSVALVLVSLGMLVVDGLNFGLDFTGGTQVQLDYATAPDLEAIRQTLDDGGFANNEVVALGSDTKIQVRVQDASGGADALTASGETAIRVTELLTQAAGGQVTFGGSSFISAQVGDELKEQGGLGMLVATVLLMIYIALRFQFKFSVGAVLSVVHDVIITLGFIAFAGIDFDLNVLASILAIIGYSLNDTVVVADRIRENFRVLRAAEPDVIIDTAVSQTLVRTTITALTTLLVLLALFLYGGPALYSFSLVLIIGVMVGTYSSIYVASSTLMFLNLTREDMQPPEKAKEELDALP